MAETLPHTRVNRINLRVWRFVATGPQWLYTYAGPIDDVVLGTVMQTIRRLTEAVPGEWLVDVLIIGIENPLLLAMQEHLHAMRRHGVQPYVRHAPAPRRAWLRRDDTALAELPPLLH
jgi:hypothetical protein